MNQIIVTRLHQVANRNHQLRAIAILLLLTSNVFIAFGQKNVENTNQQWFQYYNQSKISERWMTVTDAGYRVKNGFSQWKIGIEKFWKG